MNEEDYIKQNKLEELGYTVLRFTESEVLFRMDIVMEKLEQALYVLSKGGTQ